MMFLDCPAWWDQDGTVRCGFPPRSDGGTPCAQPAGPLEGVMIRCPAGHWFNGPNEFLAWESSDRHPQGLAGAAANAARSAWPRGSPDGEARETQ